MIPVPRHCAAVLAFLIATAFGSRVAWAGEQRPTSIEFTLSARRAADERYDVSLRCAGFAGESLEFVMPAWTPGYYQLMNYARHVEDFSAADASGRSLAWEKIDANTWRVETDGSTVVELKYAVHAPTNFIAENSLSRERAYVVPAATFLHLQGQVKHPVTLQVEPFASWSDVATGLDAVPGQSNVFAAPDFDVLYDCPLLMGNLDRIEFRVQNIPHALVGRDLGSFDRKEFVRGMTRMIESAAAIVGEIPYRHYTVLAVGGGMGGIEHANSAAISFDGGQSLSPTRNKQFMNFMCHEFFHLYNAKRIRPIELGPFNYERGNPTRMLWVAEGFTVYYEHVILKRAGLTTRSDLLNSLRASVVAYERRPGRLKQSAAESSFDTWQQGPFGAGEDTISCYDKGAALGMLLDFKIRHETQNAKSLNDVMRTLYREFHVDKGRGYTEDEFRAVCEQTAGCELQEVFDYATTTCEVDYPKYLDYAGLAIEMPGDGPREKAFGIAPVEHPTELQQSILASWLGEG